MTTHHSGAHTGPSDAGLNLLWPGLAQLEQGRTAPALFFAIDGILGWGMLLWAPDARLAVAVTLAAVTAWSLIDAYAFERERR